MKNIKITIIGGGNLGSAIGRGLVNSQELPASNLTISDTQTNALKPLRELGINVTDNNKEAVENADIVMLAIKPWLVETVVSEVAEFIDPQKTILITLAAGVTSQSIEMYYGKTLPIFAVMPNTAISIGESMTCIASRNATQEQEQLILKIFNSMGQAILIPQEMMGAATVLASCGTAYALRYIRAASQGGVEIGFGAKMATQIAAQVVKGAAELILKNGSHPEEEIDKVTTPKGITIAGLNEMEHNGLSSSVIQGLLTAFNKVENTK